MLQTESTFSRVMKNIQGAFMAMSGGHGGARPGAGRKRGGQNKATLERKLRAAHGVQAALDDGLMPLDVMLARMRNKPLPNSQRVTDEQFQAAVAAAPYLHARLQATTLKGDPDAPLVHELRDDNRVPLHEFLAQFAAERGHMINGVAEPPPAEPGELPPVPSLVPVKTSRASSWPEPAEPPPEPPLPSGTTPSPFGEDPLRWFRGPPREPPRPPDE